MAYQVGNAVIVRNIGLALIKEILPDGSLWLYFASGKRGGGWHDYDFAGAVSEREFWQEWRRFNRGMAYRR